MARSNKSDIMYKITLIGREEPTKKTKKHFKQTLIDNNFCDNPKLGMVPVTYRWVYLGLLLSASNEARECIEIPQKALRRYIESSSSIPRVLDALQSLQLLTYEKIEFLRIEEKRREEKRNSVRGKRFEKVSNEERQIDLEIDPDVTDLQATKNVSKLPAIKNATQSNDKSLTAKEKNVNHLIALYCDSWKRSYRSSSNPHISPTDARRLKDFLKNAGWRKAEMYIQNYFKMPDKWFLTKRHDVHTFLQSLNSILHFTETGKLVTHSEIHEADKTLHKKTSSDADTKALIEALKAESNSKIPTAR